MAGTEVQDHKGCVFSCLKSMCMDWGISTEVFRYRRRICGWSLKKTLETPIRKYSRFFRNIKDPETGECFKTRTAFAKTVKLSDKCIQSRIEHGLSPDMVMFGEDLRKVPSKDHLGNTYSSISEMCKHWGIRGALFSYRLSKGWSVEKSLTTPVKNNGQRGMKKKRRIRRQGE